MIGDHVAPGRSVAISLREMISADDISRSEMAARCGPIENEALMKSTMRVGGRLAAAFAAAMAVAWAAAPARAELKPEEIAVVAAKNNRESEELAKYYMKERGVPAGNLCLVDVPETEVCEREHWTWAVRPEIIKWLSDNDSQRTLRCLVTVRGIPLKIGPASEDPKRDAYLDFLAADRKQRLEALANYGQQLDRVADEVIVTAPAGGEGADQAAPTSELMAAQAELEKRLQAAQARVAKLNGAEKQQAAVQLQQLAMLAGGARVMMQGMQSQLIVQPEATELRTQFDLLRGRASGFAEIQVLLEQWPPGFQRDAIILATLERNGGQLGAIEWLDAQIEIVKKNETGASLDSELSLVLWQGDYELLRWQPNYLRLAGDQSQWHKAFPTMMVSRIDGPTVEHARRLIDDAIAVENAGGLKGKAYFDGRGIGKIEEPNQQPGSYGDYDRAVLITAQGMKEQTPIEVVLNTGPELFQAGECPDAALYCGWYSLAKYVDAFDWNQGAVAYHLASAEAETLHDAGSQVWCKRLIEDGVAATIGPVYEPYLLAFPRPEQFFALLIQGDLTLVECYYRTLPFNSWMMTLIGDPLYRPYKGGVRAAHAGEPAAAAPAS